MRAAAAPAVAGGIPFVARLALAAAAVLSGAGCSKAERPSPRDAAPAGSGEAGASVTVAVATAALAPDCGRVVLHVRSLLTVELARVPGAMGPLERGLAIAEGSCRDDGWSEALRRCLVEVPVVGPQGGAAGLWRCAAHVPPALRAKLEPRLRALAP